jgi:hypothetical protein
MREAFLPGIEIDGGDALARLQQRDRDVQRGGRFAGAALFVAEYDNVSGLLIFVDRLDQHERVP